MMLNISLLGTDLYHIVNWFFAYSILGWIVESIYMSFCNRRWTNRGFIFGPICPIYGMGALSVFFILRHFEGDYIMLFFIGSLVATTLEYLTAQLMLTVFGEVWWDYNEKPFNFKGILCLESSIAWGFYTVFLFLFLHKFIVSVVNLYPYHIGKVAVTFVLLYFMVDFMVHLYKAKMNSFPKKIQELQKAIQTFYKDF